MPVGAASETAESIIAQRRMRKDRAAPLMGRYAACVKSTAVRQAGRIALCRRVASIRPSDRLQPYSMNHSARRRRRLLLVPGLT
jgi:hypothetical protein